MTILIRFKSAEPWSYCGERIRFECEMGDGRLLFRHEGTLSAFQIEDDDGRPCAPTMDWVMDTLASGDLKREHDFSGPPERRIAALEDMDPESAYQKDPWSELRLRVLKALDELPELQRSDRAFRVALSRLWGEQPELAEKFPKKPSPKSVRRWIDERGTPGERRLNQMVSMAGRVRRQNRLHAETHAAMQEAALWYWSSRRWLIGDAYSRCIAALEKVNQKRKEDGHNALFDPSPEIFRRLVRQLECEETVREKFGARVANMRFKPCGRGISATRILQVGAMDHTMLDGVAVIDADYMLPAGRPWLTVIVDVFSGCVVGFYISFEPASIHSVMECIKRANRPKINLPPAADAFPALKTIFGRFDELIVDNGKEFAGVAMHDALADVGISLRLAPVAAPTYKAIVERFFGTLNTLLNRKLPGGVLKPELLRELGYDPYKDAVLTLHQLEDLIWDALILHHIKPPEGKGLPRAQVWEADAERYGIDVLSDDTQLDKMLGKVKYPCSVTRSGVRLFGLTYHSPKDVAGLLEDLVPKEPMRGRRKGSGTARVKVKYNPVNLAEIHVWNKVTKRYVTLPCDDEKYAAGVSLWHHQKLQEWAWQKGLEFSSERERLIVQAQMIETLEELGPKLRGKELRAFSRLSNSPAIRAKLNPNIAIAYAQSRPDGLSPVIIQHETMAADRSDGGQKPSRPAPRKKPKAKPPSRKSTRANDQRKLETGGTPDFSVDLSSWKEADL
jgi:putative transposase